MAVLELLLSAAGGAIGAYWSSYFGKIGELSAIRTSLDSIKLQVTASTEAAKAVEQKFARADVFGKVEFDFCRQQLTELYGPLYASLKTTEELYDLWIDHKMAAVNGPFKLLLAEKNKMARDLITQKAHLIEGGRMPESFNRFVTSTTIWDLYASPRPECEVPTDLAKDERAKYPKEFVDHVYEVTETLKARLNEFYRLWAIQPEVQGSQASVPTLK